MAHHNPENDSDIPVLDDLVLVDGPDDHLPDAPVTSTQHQAANATTSKDTSSNPPALEMPLNSKPVPRNNPFLPYEHLEQLARERVEFQRQFTEFTLAQQNLRASASAGPGQHGGYNSPDQSQRAAHTDTSLENLTRQLTHEVMNEMRPLVERRIRELLDERLSGFEDSDRRG